MTLKTNTQLWRSASSANTNFATRTARRIGGAVMTKRKRTRSQGAGAMPDTGKSRSSYPQAITLKTLELFPEFVNIKHSQFHDCCRAPVAWPKCGREY